MEQQGIFYELKPMINIVVKEQISTYHLQKSLWKTSILKKRDYFSFILWFTASNN